MLCFQGKDEHRNEKTRIWKVINENIWSMQNYINTNYGVEVLSTYVVALI